MNSPKITLYTMGVYGLDAGTFFANLVSAKIDLFCDIRQRRGMRGSQYAFVNSNALQSKLSELQIPYKYLKQLAPTDEIRNAQKSVDQEMGVLKRNREMLSENFTLLFQSTVLKPLDCSILSKEFIGASHVMLFCVEQAASACHRSLVTNWLAAHLGYAVQHL